MGHIRKFNEGWNGQVYMGKENFLTVGSLKKLLENHDDDMLVGVHSFGDGDLVESVSTKTPGFRGDDPIFIYDLPEDTKILYIKGFSH